MQIKHIKNVVVTGAAQGIGKNVAQLLTKEGYRLYLADINDEVLAKVADEIEADWGHVDISDKESVDAMFAKAESTLGEIDALVNVAAIDAPYALADNITAQHWNSIIDTNLSGTWWCTSCALARMKQTGGGKIINISSAWALKPARGISVAYATAKAGLLGLTIALAEECEIDGILVNAIAPGATGNTGNPVDEDRAKLYESKYPLGFGGAEPISQMVSHLLGSGGDWISGSVMNVSGGYLRG